MYDMETQSLVKKILEKLSLKFPAVYNSLRVPLAERIGERKNKRLSNIDHLRSIIIDCLFLINALILNKLKRRQLSPINKKYIFVIDHNRRPFIKLFLDIIKKLPKGDICVFTTSRKIYSRLNKEKMFQVVYIDNFVFGDLSEIKYAAKVYNEINKIDLEVTFFDRFSRFVNLLKIACYENSYEVILSGRTSTVVTLHDAQLHEQVIARVANKKNITTFTLQHGMINYLWFPLVSDYFFIWNDSTREICKSAYDIDTSKMIVTGNPFIKPKIIERIRNNIFTITYIVTNWGEVENKILFETFLKIQNINNIKIIIKLRPNAPRHLKGLYNSWIKNCEHVNIELLSDVDINDVLAQTDLIVAFSSGVAVDAMPYHIPSILLDIFDHICLSDLVGHYHDCIVVKTPEDYINIVGQIVDNKDLYSCHLQRVISVKDRYYIDAAEDEIIQLISSKIIGFSG